MSQSAQRQLACRKGHKDSCHVAKDTKTVGMSQRTQRQLACRKAPEDHCHVAKHTKQCIQINCTMRLWQAFFVASIIHPTVQWIRSKRQTLDAHIHVNYSYIYMTIMGLVFFSFSFLFSIIKSGQPQRVTSEQINTFLPYLHATTQI